MPTTEIILCVMRAELKDGTHAYVHLNPEADWVLVRDERHAFTFLGDSGRDVARRIMFDKQYPIEDMLQVDCDNGGVWWTFHLS